jgi:hypothetical protein
MLMPSAFPSIFKWRRVDCRVVSSRRDLFGVGSTSRVVWRDQILVVTEGLFAMCVKVLKVSAFHSARDKDVYGVRLMAEEHKAMVKISKGCKVTKWMDLIVILQE